MEAVTDASGARLATLAYDPFGARRKPDWTRSLNSSEIEALADDLKLKVSRGYSDHEHLDRAGFVHMNGRVYDPRTGRFLSPDPIVEDPAFSQSWHHADGGDSFCYGPDEVRYVRPTDRPTINLTTAESGRSTLPRQGCWRRREGRSAPTRDGRSPAAARPPRIRGRV